LLLAGSLAMACCFPRWHASLVPRRVCVFPLGFNFLYYGEHQGEMRAGSTQAVELGTFFFFYFFDFFLAFIFPRQVEYSAEYCRRSETARERESEERAGERGRDREK